MLIWKVEYYKTEEDRIKKVRSTSEFNSFEEAVSFFHCRVDNHNGEVKLIHPD